MASLVWPAHAAAPALDEEHLLYSSRRAACKGHDGHGFGSPPIPISEVGAPQAEVAAREPEPLPGERNSDDGGYDVARDLDTAPVAAYHLEAVEPAQGVQWLAN